MRRGAKGRRAAARDVAGHGEGGVVGRGALSTTRQVLEERGVAVMTMTSHLWINNGRINCLKEKNLDERKFIALQNANLLHCKKLLVELIVE